MTELKAEVQALKNQNRGDNDTKKKAYEKQRIAYLKSQVSDEITNREPPVS